MILIYFFRLSVKCDAWLKRSSNLYDFFSNEYYTTSSKIKTTCDISLENQEMFIHSSQKQSPFHIEVSQNDKSILTYNDTFEDTPYIVINRTFWSTERGYQIRKDDVIMFGGVRFRVVELFSSSEGKNEIKEEKDTIKPINNDINTIKSTGGPKCRICLMEEDDEVNNPLITPCHCSGSVSYIHVECLRHWLSSKVVVKEFKYFTVISKNKFECEICKTPIPDELTVNNKTISFFSFSKPKNDFLILESIPLRMHIEQEDSKYFYILKFDTKKHINIGRSNTSEIKMVDMSISRNHSVIQLYNNNFYVRDLGSKFGTLVELKNQILFLPNKPFSLLYNKCCLTFNLIRTFIGLIRCYHNKEISYRDYNAYINSTEDKKKQIPTLKEDKISIEIKANTDRSTVRELIGEGNTGQTVNNNNNTTVNNISNIGLLNKKDPSMSVTQDIPRESEGIGKLLSRNKDSPNMFNREEHSESINEEVEEEENKSKENIPEEQNKKKYKLESIVSIPDNKEKKENDIRFETIPDKGTDDKKIEEYVNQIDKLKVVNKIFDTNDKPVRIEENKGEDVSKSNVEIVNELFASNQSKVDI